MALRWGISCAGLIANDFMNALGTLSPDDHQIVAIGCHDIKESEKLAKKYEIPTAYGSYLELAQDPNVEIAYVGTQNPWHFEVSKLMMEHGKHVLVEKPMCMNSKQVEKLIALAKEKDVFLMEALWLRFCPNYQHVRKLIRSGAIGDILSVTAEFGFKDYKLKIPRLVQKATGGGIILGMGVYTIQACQWVLEKEPIGIKAKGILNEEGVDIVLNSELDYGDGKKVQMNGSTLIQLSNAVEIVGTKGKITIHLFSSSKVTVNGKVHEWPLPPAKFEFNYPNSGGFIYEAEEVRKAIRAGKREHELVPHKDSLAIARIQDELRRQLGVHYEGHDD